MVSFRHVDGWSRDLEVGLVHHIQILFCLSAILWVADITAAEGAGLPEVEVERPGPSLRHQIHLPRLLHTGSEVVLHLGVQDQKIRQAWVELPTFRSLAQGLDVKKLRIGDDSLQGGLEFSFSYPGEQRIYLARVELDASRKDSQWSGRFQAELAERGPIQISSEELVLEPAHISWSVVGGEVLRDAVSGTVGPLARTQGRVVAELATGRIVHVNDRVDRWGRAQVHLEFTDGQLSAAAVAPRQADKWQAAVVNSSATLSDDRLSVVLQLDVTGEVQPGLHELRLAMRLTGNTAAGQGICLLHGEQVNRDHSVLGSLRRVDRPAGPAVQVVRVDMPSAAAGRQTPTLEFLIDAGQATDGHVHGYRNVLGAAEVGGLRVGAERITGSVNVHYPVASSLVADEDQQASYELDLQLRDGVVSGTYAGQWGEVHRVQEALSGTTPSAAELQQREAIAAVYDWPSYVGPNQDMSANASAQPLLEDLHAARLVWASEATLPGRCQVTRYGEANLQRWLERGGPASGGGTPILYDSKIYFYYVRPAEGSLDDQTLKKFASLGTRTLPCLWASHCDDVVLCLDAATGATLWKSVVPKAGRYGVGGKRGAYTAWLCAGEGLVLVTGAGGLQHCFDAASGAWQWSVANGYGEIAQVIDGVLVTPTGRKGATDLIGRELSTGRELWRIERGGSGIATPLQWSQQGKIWVIANDERGTVRCVDVQTGEEAWRIDGLGEANATTMSLADSILIVECGRQLAVDSGPLLLVDKDLVSQEEPTTVPIAWRLTAAGATRLWALDALYLAKREGAPYRDGRFYFRDRSRKRLYAVEAATGAVLGSAPADSQGPLQIMHDRLLVHDDPTHSDTDFLQYRIRGDGIEQMGSLWPVMHQSTTGYWPIVGRHILADGRLIVRGASGIFCYDLRQP